MRFWDSSALVPLLAAEPSSERMQDLLDQDVEQTVWWATEIECVSAIARKARAGEGSPSAVREALRRLAAMASDWTEVEPGHEVRRLARRVVQVHDLRAADALQLAAALMAAEDHPETLSLVTLDDRLATAAAREGFPIVDLS